MSNKIVLIDGHSIINRAYYGLPLLTNAEGLHTNGIYGFLNILFRILEEEKPTHLCVAFDEHAPTFRHAIFEAYKGTRKAMPEELREQVPVLKEVLRAMNVRIVSKPGLEADDILGTIAKRAEATGFEVALISGDRDLLQVATEHICVRIPKTVKGQTTVYDYHAEDVLRDYQVPPLGIIDLKALMGDSSDNIPGVTKVGEKTATELLVKYGTLDGVYAHIDEITKKGLHDNLVADKENAYLSYTLATINVNADLDDFSIEEAVLPNLFTAQAYDYFVRLNFKNLLKRFDDSAKETEIKVEYTTVTSVADLPSVQSIPEGVPVAIHLEQGENSCYFALAYEEKSVTKTVILALENAIFKAMEEEKLQGYIGELRTGRLVVLFDAKEYYRNAYFTGAAGLFDCKIAAYLLDPTKNEYLVSDVATSYGETRTESLSVEFAKCTIDDIGQIANEKLMIYLSRIAYGLCHAYPVMQLALKEAGMTFLFEEVEMPLSYVLYDMEHEGILVQREEMKAYGEMLATKLVEMEKKIYEAAGEVFNINSPKQLADILFVKLAIPGGKKTKTGYSTNADVLQKLAPDYPIVADILEYRTYAKLKSTYADGLDAYIAGDGRIHTTFQQTVTATGRISSTEPNLQNIPTRTQLGRMIRKMFVPKAGCVFLDADYSQIELRLLAVMSKDSELIAAYHNGEDIHRITASKVFGVPFEEVTDLQRRNAKAVNFGIVYGISSFGLSEDLSISREEAKQYIEQYFATYPGIKSYLDGTVASAKKEGVTRTLYGRIRPMPELKSSNYMERQFGERVAMNAPIQGTAADIMKLAMISLHDALAKNNLKSKMILQVHDEVLVECPIEEKDKVMELIVSSMQNAPAYREAMAYQFPVPLTVEAHEGVTWYDAK